MERTESHVRAAAPARITIFDTTLRDGEQAPCFSMCEAEKVRLARKLDALGVDVMEAGFPIASEDDFNSVRAIAREVRRARRHVNDVEFSAEDATRSDLNFLVAVVEAVVEAGATTVNLPDTVWK